MDPAGQHPQHRPSHHSGCPAHPRCPAVFPHPAGRDRADGRQGARPPWPWCRSPLPIHFAPGGQVLAQRLPDDTGPQRRHRRRAVPAARHRAGAPRSARGRRVDDGSRPAAVPVGLTDRRTLVGHALLHRKIRGGLRGGAADGRRRRSTARFRRLSVETRNLLGRVAAVYQGRGEPAFPVEPSGAAGRVSPRPTPSVFVGWPRTHRRPLRRHQRTAQPQRDGSAGGRL